MSPDGLTALAAAAMMAASPITGECRARTISLCTGDGLVHTVLIWDQDGSPQPRPTGSANKACHACLPDKRKAKSDIPDPDKDEI